MNVLAKIYGVALLLIAIYTANGIITYAKYDWQIILLDAIFIGAAVFCLITDFDGGGIHEEK